LVARGGSTSERIDAGSDQPGRSRRGREHREYLRGFDQARIRSSHGTRPSRCSDSAGLPFLKINEHHAKLAGELPLIHRDPFDRMLVAQAMLEQLVIVTSDAEIPRYGVPVVW
jgi:hypothetical protein